MRVKKGLLFLYFTAVFVLSISILSAYTCSFETGACSAGKIPIVKLSSPSNAHAEMLSGSNYNTFLCCNIQSQANCNGNPSILNLYSETNSHVQVGPLTTYTNKICLDNFVCNSVVDPNLQRCADRSPDYPIEFLSLSSESNAHVGGFLDYPMKICCKNIVPAVDCNPGEICVFPNINSPIDGLIYTTGTIGFDAAGSRALDCRTATETSACTTIMGSDLSYNWILKKTSGSSGSEQTFAGISATKIVEAGNYMASLNVSYLGINKGTQSEFIVRVLSNCGNGFLDEGEECDESLSRLTRNSFNCTDLTHNPPYIRGELSCISEGDSRCTFETNQCVARRTVQICADHVTMESCNSAPRFWSQWAPPVSLTDGKCSIQNGEGCEWIGNKCALRSDWVQENPGDPDCRGATPISKCYYSESTSGDCTKDEFIEISYLLDGVSDDTCNANKASKKILCPSKIKLSFFGYASAVISIVLLVIIYYLILKNKKKNNKTKSIAGKKTNKRKIRRR